MYYIIFFLLLGVPVHALDYTYNATSGLYNVTTDDYVIVPNNAYSVTLEKEYYEYDATNESYIALLSLSDILEDQHDFYDERRYNSSYQGRYNESLYLNESKVNEVIRQCDEVLQFGQKLLNETNIEYEGRDYHGVLEVYSMFLKIKAVTPAILQCKVNSAYVLTDIKSDLGTYDVNIDRNRENDYRYFADTFKYDDTEAKQNAESAASILDEQEREKEYQADFNASGIKIVPGQYESSLVTVPMGDYVASFQIRTLGKMTTTNITASQYIGSGKSYHMENFTLEIFVMAAGEGTLNIAIAHYTGPAKYEPANPLNAYHTAKEAGGEIWDPIEVNVDGRAGTELIAENRRGDISIHTLNYTLDKNTFVLVRAESLDGDKDFNLVTETLHIEKKMK